MELGWGVSRGLGWNSCFFFGERMGERMGRDTYRRYVCMYIRMYVTLKYVRGELLLLLHLRRIDTPCVHLITTLGS